MTNTELFRDAVQKSGLKYKYLASELGISPYGLALKIKNLNEFKASEIVTLSNLLGLSTVELENIFFARDDDFKSRS